MAIVRNYVKKSSGSSATATFVDDNAQFKSVVARTCEASDPNNVKPVPTGLTVTSPHNGKLAYPRGVFSTEIIFCTDDAATLKQLLPTLDPPGKYPTGKAATWTVDPGITVMEEDPPPPPPNHPFDPGDVWSLV